MSWVITGSEKTPVDPQFTSVSLLLHGNGSNGSTTIVDSSRFAHAVTTFGNAQISTSQSKFGGASIAFDGNGDYLRVASTASLNFGNQPFTVEAFIYLPAGFNSTGTLFSQRQGGGPTFRIESTKALRAFSGDANLGDDVISAATLSTETWTHVACTRQAGIYRLWINGTIAATSSAYTGSLPANLTTDIGARSGLEYLTGNIDELRVTLGVARYTANFTPPTAPFPDI
jgi:hypothetical protein